MPQSFLYVFRDGKKKVPLMEWLDPIADRARDAYYACHDRMCKLSEKGNELKRPYADYLRDAIYELRAGKGKVNYRILYFFFNGPNCICLCHGCTKEGEVSDVEIERAIERKRLVNADPAKYTAVFQL